MKKKKIGIITELSLYTVNYGNHIQAYALNYYLNTHYSNVDAETILLKRNTGRKYTSIVSLIKRAKLKIRKVIYYKSHKITFVDSRFKEFEKFANGNIRITNTEMTLEDIEGAHYDIIIVGSDVVWYQTPGYVERCKFIDIKGKPSLKKIAFSASFGKNNIPECNKKIIKNYLDDFDKISVRESSAINLLSNMGITNVINTCDPTLLLDVDEWRKISQKPDLADYGIDIDNTEYVFAYILGNNDEQILKLKKICNDNNVRLYYIPFIDGRYNNSNTNDQELLNCSPKEWIWMIEHAKYIITDSFHGLVFSIIFNKNFLSIKRVNSEDINIRITDLLEYIGARDKLVNIEDISDLKIYNWNFSLYNLKVQQLVKTSKEYLDQIISDGG